MLLDRSIHPLELINWTARSVHLYRADAADFCLELRSVECGGCGGTHAITYVDAHTPAELLNWVLDRGGIESGLCGIGAVTA